MISYGPRRSPVPRLMLRCGCAARLPNLFLWLAILSRHRSAAHAKPGRYRAQSGKLCLTEVHDTWPARGSDCSDSTCTNSQIRRVPGTPSAIDDVFVGNDDIERCWRLRVPNRHQCQQRNAKNGLNERHCRKELRSGISRTPQFIFLWWRHSTELKDRSMLCRRLSCLVNLDNRRHEPQELRQLD